MKTLRHFFLFTALKLVAKKFFEYEQEIKLIERKLTFTTILVNFPLNLFLELSEVLPDDRHKRG